MLNERSREILAFIQRFTRENGYPPTIREIGEEFKIASTNGVRYYTSLLLKAGHLQHSDRVSRGLRPVDRGAPSVSSNGGGIPILGRVAAGQPILAESNLEGTLSTEQVFGDTDGLFALRVRGDSMIDAGILEGDYVIVRSQDRADSGQIVVGLLGDEATVKYFHPKRGGVELVAANAKYAPIQVGPDDAFQILGVVRGVIRTVGR